MSRLVVHELRVLAVGLSPQGLERWHIRKERCRQARVRALEEAYVVTHSAHKAHAGLADVLNIMKKEQNGQHKCWKLGRI